MRKHDKKRRVTIEKVHFDFSEEVNEIIKNRILDFFQHIIQYSKRIHAKKLLTISFRQEKPNLLIGDAIQKDSTMSLYVYTIHISTECGSSE